MSGRMTLGSLLVLALMTPALCVAQGTYGEMPMGGQPMMLPPPMSACENGWGGPHNVSPRAGRRIFEELPDDRGWLFEDAPLFQAIRKSFRHSYFRAEYLVMDTKDPGHQLLGAYPADGTDPRLPFLLLNPGTGALAGTAIAPALDTLSIENMNGFRGTFGLPVGSGAFESSLFVLAKNRSELNHAADITPGDLTTIPVLLPTFVVQNVLQDGVPSNSFLIYDQSYEAVLKTGVWGAEGNYVFTSPSVAAGDLFSITPIVGFKYFNYREELLQGGVYNFLPVGGVQTIPVERRIDATTVNNLYGPQFGLRGEMNFWRVTIGAEPKIMLGVNSYKADLFTSQVTAPDDPALHTSKAATTFGPVGDLKVYSRVGLSENFHAFVAYNLTWAGMITKPQNNIIYNTNVATGDSAFAQRVKFSDAVLTGISVGVEWRF